MPDVLAEEHIDKTAGAMDLWLASAIANGRGQQALKHDLIMGRIVDHAGHKS